MTGIIDSSGRSINYLRISVTDRCNLRCIYCLPPEGVRQMSHSEILSYEEIRTIVQVAAELGINKVRLTGGEPLVRADFPELVKMLTQIEGIRELSLTTNGTLLKKYARELKQAGVSRLNVSLDTLKEDRFRHIIRLGRLKDVLEGIEAAKEAGFGLVKINTVVMRGINEDEVLDFARMTCEDAWHIRFILTGDRGTIGFISPLTETSFCSRCNRRRLTPDGRLHPCLLGEDEIDLKTPLRNNASPEELRRLILKAVASKPEHHHLEVGNTTLMKRKMSQIGG